MIGWSSSYRRGFPGDVDDAFELENCREEVSRKGAKKRKRKGAKEKHLRPGLRIGKASENFSFASFRFLFFAPLRETAFFRLTPHPTHRDVGVSLASANDNHRVACHKHHRRHAIFAPNRLN